MSLFLNLAPSRTLIMDSYVEYHAGVTMVHPVVIKAHSGVVDLPGVADAHFLYLYFQNFADCCKLQFSIPKFAKLTNFTRIVFADHLYFKSQQTRRFADRGKL